MRRLACGLAPFLLAGAPVVLAECPGAWNRMAAAGPEGRYGFALAYDAAGSRTLVFGGTDDANRDLGDTWGWDGATWTRLATTGPQARKTASMAADTARDRLVLFGGNVFTGGQNRYFPETWEWDGSRWEQRASSGPPGRCCAAMAYDTARGRAVLFGGDVNGTAQADTWEWDGAVWERKTVAGPQPAARHSHAMAYDPARGRVVLFGGSTASGLSSETWEWDGTGWTRRDVSGPSARVRAALAFEPASRTLLLLGGDSGGTLADTRVWRLGPSGWSLAETAELSPRSGHGLAYDGRRERLVTFGGSTAGSHAADTWERLQTRDEARLVPIVLDTFGVGGARFRTELALTNRGTLPLDTTLHYTASLGARLGSGSIVDRLDAAEQRVIPDVLSHLRERGLPIPSAAESGQGGTLRVVFGCAAAPEDVAAVARTTSPTQAPLPSGSAGLAYQGLTPEATGSAPLAIDGLRVSTADRSNVAVYSASGESVTLRVTAVSGGGDGRREVLAEALELPPWGFAQYSFGSSGVTNGWALVERVAGQGLFGAFGVVNDNGTNDGSFVFPARSEPASFDVLHVPVLVETPTFVSELVATNRGERAETLRLRFIDSFGGGAAGPVELALAPGEQRILPRALDFLRREGAGLLPPGPPYAGALRVELAGGGPHAVSVSARTASIAGTGGFGLFTPGVAADGAASERAFLFGLRADAENRSNVALVATGGPDAGALELSVQAHGGGPASPTTVRLEPGAWKQLDGFLGGAGVANGWVEVTRTSGSGPWLAYAVVNDGGAPGERTGDGAYVPMSVPREVPAPAPRVLSVGGTYAVAVALLDNTCGSVTVQPQPTSVSHTVGAAGFVLAHGALSYRGLLQADGPFTTEPRTLASGAETLSIRVDGRFLTTGFEAVATVDVRRPSGSCAYHVRWTGTKQGAPNVFP